MLMLTQFKKIFDWNKTPTLVKVPSFYSMLLWPLPLAVAVTLLSTGLVAAQDGVELPASASPHWDHINVYDAGHAIPSMTHPTNPAYPWFLAHMDATQANGLSRSLLGLNPGIKLSHHQIDLTVVAGPEATALPESYFLHLAERTELKFINPDGSVEGTVTLRGCPKSLPVALDCRLQVYLRGSRRYVYNVFDGGFLTWKTTQLQHHDRSLDMVILDEHAPGFIQSMQWGKQTVVISGGSIREFREEQIGLPGTAWDQFYNDGVVAWLAHLAGELQSERKSVLLNVDNSFFHPMMLAQINAVHGVRTVGLHRPDALIGGPQYQAFLNVVQGAVTAGGVVDLHGSWCHTGPVGYTSGLYGTSIARYRMWRLSSYYLLKEPMGSSGIVYFDPSFCSNASGKPFYDQYEWLPAYQFNVGQPAGPPILYQEGFAGRTPTNGQSCPYQVFARSFTHATVLVRPRDGWACTNYSDTSGVTVSVPHDGLLLMENGLLLPITKTITLRNAEAAILINASGTSAPPSALTD